MVRSKLTFNALHRRMIVFAVLALVVASVAISFVIIKPLYHRMQQEEFQNLHYERKNVIILLNQYVKRIKDITRQISSRTRASQLLQEYQNQKISREIMQFGLQRILLAAMRQNSEIIGIMRLDANGKVAASVGNTIAKNQWRYPSSSKDAEIFGPIMLNGKSYATTSKTILGVNGKKIGTDVVMFDIGNLLELLAQKQFSNRKTKLYIGYVRDGQLGLLLTPGQREFKGWSRENDTLARVLRLAIERRQLGEAIGQLYREEVAFAFGPIPNSYFGIAVGISVNELLIPLRNHLYWLLYAIGLITLLLAFAVVLVFRSLTAKIDFHMYELIDVARNKSEQLDDAKDQLHKMAVTDSATQLANQKQFYHLMDTEIKRAHRYKQMFALVFIHIGHLKDIRLRVGYQACDELLNEIGKRIHKFLRAGDIAGRVGEDNLALVLANIQSEQEILTAIERLKEKLVAQYEVSGHNLLTDFSFGIAMYPQDGLNSEALLQNADQALTRAEANPELECVFFQDHL